MTLTALEIKHAKEGMHSDGNGLYLRVQKNDAKSWIFRFQLNGRRREMGIGTLANKQAKEARAEALNLLALVRSGTDPIENRKQIAKQLDVNKKKSESLSKTFHQVAKEYIESHKAGWKSSKHAAQWTNTLATYAIPVIGEKPVAHVNTDDVLQILKPIWDTKTETASRLRSRIELVISYAKALKIFEGENPANWRGHLDALLPKPNKVRNVQHFPSLPYEKIPNFVAKLRTIPGTGSRALEFVILTAARTGEVLNSTWSEIDLTNGLWTIPAERMKGGREHWVTLSNQATALLKSLPKVEGNNFLFPGNRDRKPLSNMTLNAIIRRLNKTDSGPPAWLDPKSGNPIVPHGFRSTFRDWAAEVGKYPREVAEHAIAHSLPDKTEAAYQRGTMIERRRPMMQEWADYIEKM